MAELETRLSLGELSLDALIEIKSGLSEISGLMGKLFRLQTDYQQRGPIYVPVGGQAASNSSGSTFAIDLGGPAALRRWELRQLVVGGVLFSSTVAGTALLIQSSSIAGANEPPLPNVEDQAAALPKIAFYSSGQVLVRHPNHLFVVVLNPTASTTYTVGGEALDAPDVALPGMYSE
jgi:hypothetical protein